MVQLTRPISGEVARTYDFAGMKRIVDVGGGYGTLVVAILKTNPHLQGVLLDLPHAIEGARKYLKVAGLANRCDFFESIPAGADVYLLKTIIHDWNDEQSILILRNCRDAIPRDRKLLLIERIMPSRLGPSSAHRAVAYADLAMLVGPGGRERTEEEFRALLHCAGFELIKIIVIALEYKILEAVPR